MIRISGQFAVTAEERRREGARGGGRRPRGGVWGEGGCTQFISFCQDILGSHRDCVSLSACVIELLKQITCLVLMLFKHMQP